MCLGEIVIEKDLIQIVANKTSVRWNSPTNRRNEFQSKPTPNHV